ncbi:hypothetical protein EUV02_03935 [Polymorphobacter arshaanensis]|uniref:Uncharacterized protein n=1 Tax=Glacieibacterium arshaanense TaxID=2511025 RepID=A0A4Y9ERA6_9SPHN|nr:hypothetical protein [Polymorphobacter arshaanensis]TFU06171.1 hypothetical protein EUV02_03935 [Polymorphobacter arshaanensis]
MAILSMIGRNPRIGQGSLSTDALAYAPGNPADLNVSTAPGLPETPEVPHLSDGILKSQPLVTVGPEGGALNTASILQDTSGIKAEGGIKGFLHRPGVSEGLIALGSGLLSGNGFADGLSKGGAGFSRAMIDAKKVASDEQHFNRQESRLDRGQNYVEKNGDRAAGLAERGQDYVESNGDRNYGLLKINSDQNVINSNRDFSLREDDQKYSHMDGDRRFVHTVQNDNAQNANARENTAISRYNAYHKDAPSGYRMLPNGNMEAIPGGPADAGARLTSGAIKELTGPTETVAKLQDLTGTFRDDFAGQYGTGRIANFMGRHGVDKKEDQAKFWQSADALNNVDRNVLFGGALTPVEAAEWDKTSIDPGMSPSVIRANIAARTRITQRVRDRLAATYKASGYSKTGVDAATSTNTNDPYAGYSATPG